MTSPLEIVVLAVGDSIRGYDFRDVLGVKEADADDRPFSGRYVVTLGRMGPVREVRCSEILGSRVIAAGDIRPVPAVLSERMDGEKPWAAGITGQEICLLY